MRIQRKPLLPKHWGFLLWGGIWVAIPKGVGMRLYCQESGLLLGSAPFRRCIHRTVGWGRVALLSGGRIMGL